MAATGLNHVSISAADLEESVRFYEELFGLERIATPNFGFPVQWLRCYCGDGTPHTAAGVRVEMFDSAGVHEPRAAGYGAFEALWGPEGAVCLARSRRLEFPLAEILRACPRLAECPRQRAARPRSTPCPARCSATARRRLRRSSGGCGLYQRPGTRSPKPSARHVGGERVLAR